MEEKREREESASVCATDENVEMDLCGLLCRFSSGSGSLVLHPL